ncbi:GNAT family N-acetyltransferase [Allorhizobium sp. BGMRC 0089]|uniref:GNAT family N-acetyltransferase n=1 Tax=Allorhizobium sonneratiae TaxID=2934936 RepID=UPI0020349161|nr:GNAT family N-acetyltransferase [Allorhizobium sonneratiae]MCM2290792.1 GNAT family N-acetyltransferase [Allorhizobium sonneratiae]
MLVMRPVADALPQEVRTLAVTAKEEGFSHIERLVREWDDGFRYGRRGEVLLAGWQADHLAAIGGVTHDPVLSDALRMRRFYVHRDYRRQGVGRTLARSLLDHALSFHRPLFVHAGTADAASFWEAMGFSRHEQDGHTHHFTINDNQEEDP